jgi:hypothetical protein
MAENLAHPRHLSQLIRHGRGPRGPFIELSQWTRHQRFVF